MRGISVHRFAGGCALLLIGAAWFVPAAIAAPKGTLVDTAEYKARQERHAQVLAENRSMEQEIAQLRQRQTELEQKKDQQQGERPNQQAVIKMMSGMLAEPYVEWRTPDGRTLVGQRLYHDANTVQIKRADGTVRSISRSLLADADNRFLDQLTQYLQAGGTAPGTLP